MAQNQYLTSNYNDDDKKFIENIFLVKKILLTLENNYFRKYRHLYTVPN